MDIDSCKLLFHHRMACLWQARREINTDDSIFKPGTAQKSNVSKSHLHTPSENKVTAAFSNTAQRSIATFSTDYRENEMFAIDR